jgi:hypothetical protein
MELRDLLGNFRDLDKIDKSFFSADYRVVGIHVPSSSFDICNFDDCDELADFLLVILRVGTLPYSTKLCEEHYREQVGMCEEEFAFSVH